MWSPVSQRSAAWLPGFEYPALSTPYFAQNLLEHHQVRSNIRYREPKNGITMTIPEAFKDQEIFVTGASGGYSSKFILLDLKIFDTKVQINLENS